MDDVARHRGRSLAIILGGLAVLFGIAAVTMDLFQGEGFNSGPLVIAAVGLIVLASARNGDALPRIDR